MIQNSEYWAKEYAWMKDKNILKVYGVPEKDIEDYVKRYEESIDNMKNLEREFESYYALPYNMAMGFFVISSICVVGSILMRQTGFTMGTLVLLVISGAAYFYVRPKVEKIRDEFQMMVNALEVFSNIVKEKKELKKYADQAEKYLQAKNYEKAAQLYEQAEMWEKAGEIRSMK